MGRDRLPGLAEGSARSRRPNASWWWYGPSPGQVPRKGHRPRSAAGPESIAGLKLRAPLLWPQHLVEPDHVGSEHLQRGVVDPLAVVGRGREEDGLGCADVDVELPMDDATAGPSSRAVHDGAAPGSVSVRRQFHGFSTTKTRSCWTFSVGVAHGSAGRCG